MASFRSKFQIPGLIATKEYGRYSVLLRNPSMMRSINQNIRLFWFRKSKKPIEPGTGHCGKPQPSRMEPCTGCPSRCLEEGYGKPLQKPKRRFLSFRKEPTVVKEKPSNCEEVKNNEEKLSFWEQLFGADPKRSWPDPCSCRLAHQRRKKCREEDGRLRDSRYQATDGDVLLYTEKPRCQRRSCMEPQPKPPPMFKVPKAVMCRMMIEGKLPSNCADSGWLMDENCQSRCIMPMSHRIPYEEMRPQEKRRKIFSCREGIRPEDVIKPFGKESSPYGVPLQTFKLDPDYILPEKVVAKTRKFEDKSNLKQKVQKRSRIEQLKILIQEKNTSACISSTS